MRKTQVLIIGGDAGALTLLSDLLPYGRGRLTAE